MAQPQPRPPAPAIPSLFDFFDSLSSGDEELRAPRGEVRRRCFGPSGWPGTMEATAEPRTSAEPRTRAEPRAEPRTEPAVLAPAPRVNRFTRARLLPKAAEPTAEPAQPTAQSTAQPAEPAERAEPAEQPRVRLTPRKGAPFFCSGCGHGFALRKTLSLHAKACGQTRTESGEA